MTRVETIEINNVVSPGTVNEDLTQNGSRRLKEDDTSLEVKEWSGIPSSDTRHWSI